MPDLKIQYTDCQMATVLGAEDPEPVLKALEDGKNTVRVTAPNGTYVINLRNVAYIEVK